MSEGLSDGPVLPMMKPITVGACVDCSQGYDLRGLKKGQVYCYGGACVTTTSVNVIPETGEDGILLSKF